MLGKSHAARSAQNECDWMLASATQHAGQDQSAATSKRSGIWPLSYVTVDAWTLFFSLVLISMACIIMGADAAPALLSFSVWMSPGFSHDEA